MNNHLVIGIAGGSGSGKTTLTNQIASQFIEQVTIIKHDNYYKAHDDMTYEERCCLNYDHPNAFDTDLMIEHLKELKNGNKIECPVYDFTVHNRSKDTLTISPNKVIIVEGILIFENPELLFENPEYKGPADTIEFRPAGEEEGQIVFQFDDQFGVCGTGLSGRAIYLGEHAGNMGIYDNDEKWSFIVLDRNYVILNQSGDWWSEYKDEVMEILSTIDYE
mgnify:CR=1 FL=1